MTAPMGGYRDRLITESLFRLVRTSLLDVLGWNAPGRANRPLTVRSTPVGAAEEVPLNTLVVSAEDVAGENIEIGSHAAEDTHPHWVDFYAENDDVGAHLIGDVREILRGKLAGRSAPVLDVYDWDQATPPLLFSCLLERIRSDRAHGFTRAHEAHWYACEVDVVDEVD